MKYVRIYNGPDNLAHFEDIEVATSGEGEFAEQSALLQATGVLMRRSRGDYDTDWHNAPRRQFIVNLSGWLEMTASDGEVRRFGPGEIVLADDLQGKGHISRAVDGGERLSLLLPLPE